MPFYLLFEYLSAANNWLQLVAIGGSAFSIVCLPAQSREIAEAVNVDSARVAVIFYALCEYSEA